MKKLPLVFFIFVSVLIGVLFLVFDAGILAKGWGDWEWGEVIYPGERWGGVDVKNNFQGKTREPSDCDTRRGEYGCNYECVELAQRFASQKLGLSTKRWGVNADSMWEKGKDLGFQQYKNDSGDMPAWGDLLVFAPCYQFGHVAVVTEVKDGHVYFAEQNWAGTGYSKLAVSPGGDIQDRGESCHVFGWLRYPGQTTPAPPVDTNNFSLPWDEGPIALPPGATDSSTGLDLELNGTSRYQVEPNQKFTVSVSVTVRSGELKKDRGDHLNNVNGQGFGAWSVQEVKGTVSTGNSYTFKFEMTAPGSEGSYQSIWQMKVGGNLVGSQFPITLVVQRPPEPPPPTNVKGASIEVKIDPPSPSGSKAVSIYAKTNLNNIRATRVLIDGNVIYEIGGSELTTAWQTSAYADGKHTIIVEAAQQGDNDWSRPARHQTDYVLLTRPTEDSPDAPTPTPTPRDTSTQLVSAGKYKVTPGEAFTAQVKFKPITGRLDGSRGDKVRHVSGQRFGAATEYPVDRVYAEGETVTFNIPMQAFSTLGTFESGWQMNIEGKDVGEQGIVYVTVYNPDVPSPTPPPGPVIGYWHFEEGLGDKASDDAQVIGTGILSGNYSWRQQGYSGRFVYFGGDPDSQKGKVCFPQNNYLDTIQTFTIAFFIDRADWVTNDGILYKTSENGSSWVIRLTDSKPQVELYGTAGSVIATSKEKLTGQGWQKLEVSFNGETIRIYIDSSDVTGDTQTLGSGLAGGIRPVSTGICFGNNYEMESSFVGGLDELSITTEPRH